MNRTPSSGAHAGNPDCGHCRAMAARYTSVHTVTCSDCTGGECPLCGELTLRWTGERMLGCPECGVHWPGAVILSNEGFADARARWGWPDSQRVRRQVRAGQREHRAAKDPHPPWHGSPMAWVRMVGQRRGGGVAMAPSADIARPGTPSCPGCQTAFDQFVAGTPEVPSGMPVAITCAECSELDVCPICGGSVISERLGGGSWLNPRCRECGAVAFAQGS